MIVADRQPKLLDVVALLNDMPEHGLARGQVGTIVDDPGGEDVLVEFADAEGRAFASPNLRRSDLLLLAYEPEPAK